MARIRKKSVLTSIVLQEGSLQVDQGGLIHKAFKTLNKKSSPKLDKLYIGYEYLRSALSQLMLIIHSEIYEPRKHLPKTVNPANAL